MTIHSNTFSPNTRIRSASVNTNFTDIDTVIQEGWTPAEEIWTWTGYDGTRLQGSFSVAGVDVTAKYPIGCKIKFTQPTDGVKYAIIVKTNFSAGDTTVTIFVDTSSDFDNEAITLPFFSTGKSPLDFPLGLGHWRLTTINTTGGLFITSPGAGTIHNVDNFQRAVGIGEWNVTFRVVVSSNLAAKTIQAAVSDANNTFSNTNGVAGCHIITDNERTPLTATSRLTFTSDGTIYLNTKAVTAGIGFMWNNNAEGPAWLEAVLAYV